jgi:membrane-associated protein
MEQLIQLMQLFLHLDKHLAEFVIQYREWTYLLLWAIVFCETGLVVTPFLPGDSLLFAAGATAALPAAGLSVHLIAVLLFVAAVIGDAVNYYIGSKLGTKPFDKPNARFFKRKYLEKTQDFYRRYGGKTVVIARFVPIVRTFAPFLAGVGAMSYTRFFAFNVIGAFLWVVMFVYGGYFFGALPFVKKNFSLVILAIIILSIAPAVIEVLRERSRMKAQVV